MEGLALGAHQDEAASATTGIFIAILNGSQGYRGLRPEQEDLSVGGGCGGRRARKDTLVCGGDDAVLFEH